MIQSPTMAGSKCEVCGAPDDGTRVMCAYCGQAVSAQAAQTAVPCPGCQTRNRAGQVACVHCNARLPTPPPAQVYAPQAAGAPAAAQYSGGGGGGSLGASIDRGDPPRMPSY
jgi:hypothetical protein